MLFVLMYVILTSSCKLHRIYFSCQWKLETDLIDIDAFGLSMYYVHIPHKLTILVEINIHQYHILVDSF